LHRLLNIWITIRGSDIILALLSCSIAWTASISNHPLNILFCLFIYLWVINTFSFVFHLLLILLNHIVVSLITSLHSTNRWHSLNRSTNIDTSSKYMIHIRLIRFSKLLNIRHLSNWVVLLHVGSLKLGIIWLLLIWVSSSNTTAKTITSLV
jgi:hypothetical protein